MRVRAPVFTGTWPWGGCSKGSSFRGYVGGQLLPPRRGRGALLLHFERRKQEGTGPVLSPSLVFCRSAHGYPRRAEKSNGVAPGAPDRSSHSSAWGCWLGPTQTAAALVCQGIGSATSRGLASVERSQLGGAGWLRSGQKAQKAQAALASTAVRRSGSKTVLFLSMK